MEIALIGNGPVSYSDGSKVDSFDYVVRLNSSKNYGLAGRRTDLLFMPDAPLILNDRALDWRVFDTALAIFSLSSELNIYGRRIQPLPVSWKDLQEKLTSIGWKSEVRNPSTGLLAIAALWIMYPQATIHLFGFTHKVAPSLHDGDKERELAAALIANGVLVRHSELDKFPFNLLQAIRRESSSFERRALTWFRRRRTR